MERSGDLAPDTVLARAVLASRGPVAAITRGISRYQYQLPPMLMMGMSIYRGRCRNSCNGHLADEFRSKSSSTVNPSKIEQRLQRIESILKELSETVEKALEAATAKPVLCNDGLPCRETQTSNNNALRVDPLPGLFVGPSNSFSFLKEASNNIKAASQTSTTFPYQKARSELQYLSTSLTTATVNMEGIGEMTRFYIPPKAVGYQLMGSFLEHAPTGEPFFSTPSDDLLKQIVFNPDKVVQKAWVVYYNYIMLAQASTEEKSQGNQAENFRRNMRIALNDSSIFLEPRKVNVQALTLLALHGEDYASPNLSWMLVGHACRQAEALGLHVPSHPDFESHQRRLSIFWLLFIVDKSCSLAFGRSPFLPMNLYQDVPLPDFSYLLRFQPHTDTFFSDSQTTTKPSHFGAHFFITGVKLAKIMGSMIDLLAPGPSVVSRQEIRTRLEKWYETTNKVLTETMEAERQFLGTAQLKEMSLGLNSMRFQYLHIVIILFKGDDSYLNLRLEAAREALFLLPSIVSNWSSVYNGVIWHLLYYPFIPFFVVFENLVQNYTFQSAMTIDQDLKLLATTVSYFASMRAQMRLLATVCSRLERVAAVFLQLAKSYLGRRVLLSDDIRGSGRSTIGNSLSNTSLAPVQPTNGDEPLNSFKGKETNFNWNQDEDGPALEDDVEIGNFLNWLPADSFTTGLFMERGQHNEAAPANTAVFSAGLSSPESSRGRKRAFDATFDWFSWDAYYTDEDSRQVAP
ncbi:fungal specific transcription factor domain-containing protein [Colletotrichum tofieldiae]|uniref:Fungal specific transcription factor domain-containing protein n=1 Tax=Colletotrichum tofieldiae TaxID=708197 RepID=A0A161Y703_9PEZI|nr:fungal specific transcription factor domain-containing protein [Colletotrichum tofieldiae]